VASVIIHRIVDMLEQMAPESSERWRRNVSLVADWLLWCVLAAAVVGVAALVLEAVQSLS
jgi:hypothetical protein